MQKRAYLKGTVFILSLLAVPVVQAHYVTPEGTAWMAGLSHPLLGWDHLLVILAVALWSAQQQGPRIWFLPVVFVTVMAVAVAIGGTGAPLLGVGTGVAASLLVLGLLLAFAIRLPTVFSAVLVGLFALFHGVAHGAQISTTASAVTHDTVLVLSTAVLQIVGVRLGRVCTGKLSAALLRFGGGAIAAGSVLAWV